MGMGSVPCHAWTISLDGLKAICPQEVEACDTVLAGVGHDWDSFALAMSREDEIEEMEEPWEQLQAAFRKATRVGKSHLELDIGHYSSDDGDRYDELEDGCYFAVDGVIQLSPAGEKFKDRLEEKTWTVFG